MFLSSCRRAFCAFDTFDFVYVHELLRWVLEEDFFFVTLLCAMLTFLPCVSHCVAGLMWFVRRIHGNV